jgi:hypothetical protein
VNSLADEDAERGAEPYRVEPAGGSAPNQHTAKRMPANAVGTVCHRPSHADLGYSKSLQIPKYGNNMLPAMYELIHEHKPQV